MITNSRKSGILCHITSLPNSFGIGDIGPSAYHFIDDLKSMGQKKITKSTIAATLLPGPKLSFKII